MRLGIFIITMLFAFSGAAQFSITGGGSILKGFDNQKPWGGIHIGAEIPRDDASSLYGRFTHHFYNDDDSISANSGYLYVNPRDINSGLPPKFIGAVPSMNYNMFEGGVRYYLGNGFDFGWSAYGGSCIMLIFNKVKMDYSPYDEALYELPENIRYEGSIFSLAAGLGGGVKYSTASQGTFYFDINMAYTLLAQPSNPNMYTYMYSPLIFNFNIGYRRDLFL